MTESSRGAQGGSCRNQSVPSKRGMKVFRGSPSCLHGRHSGKSSIPTLVNVVPLRRCHEAEVGE